MSLDVYLTVKEVIEKQSTKIFVREGGQVIELSPDEWERKYPGREPVVVEYGDDDGEVYSANITHNLGKMADEAGLYESLWQPEEIGVTKAAHLIERLKQGLATLKADRERFEEFNPSNGWGNYDGLVRFTENYLEACRQYPDAEVYASR